MSKKRIKVDLFKIIFDSLSNDTSSLELYAHRKQSTVMKVLFICHKFQLQFLHNIVDKTPLMQHILFCWIDFFFSIISTKKFKFSWFFVVDCCRKIYCFVSRTRCELSRSSFGKKCFFLIRHLVDNKKKIFQKSLNKVEMTIKRDGSTWFEVVLLLCLCWLPQNISESAGAVLFHSQKNLIAKRSKNLNTLTFFGRLNRNIKKVLEFDSLCLAHILKSIIVFVPWKERK